MPGHWLDWIIISIVGLSVLTGLFRGFVKELIALGVWILAIWLAFKYSTLLDPWLQAYLHDKTARMVSAFVLIFLATLIGGGLFNALLNFILKRSGLSGTDRILGMGFGFIRGVFIVALLIVGVKVASLPHEDYRRESRLYAQFDPLVNRLSGYLPEFINKMKALDTKNLPTVGNIVPALPADMTKPSQMMSAPTSS